MTTTVSTTTTSSVLDAASRPAGASSERLNQRVDQIYKQELSHHDMHQRMFRVTLIMGVINVLLVGTLVANQLLVGNQSNRYVYLPSRPIAAASAPRMPRWMPVAKAGVPLTSAQVLEYNSGRKKPTPDVLFAPVEPNPVAPTSAAQLSFYRFDSHTGQTQLCAPQASQTQSFKIACR